MKGEASCLLYCWFTVVLTSIILFACSFSAMSVNLAGLKFNGIHREYAKDKVKSDTYFAYSRCIPTNFRCMCERQRTRLSSSL